MGYTLPEGSFFDFYRRQCSRVLSINRELAAVSGVTLSESSMIFEERAVVRFIDQTRIHQTKYTSGRALSCMLIRRVNSRDIIPDSWAAVAEQGV